MLKSHLFTRCSFVFRFHDNRVLPKYTNVPIVVKLLTKNKLETVKGRMSLNAHLHLSWCFEFKLNRLLSFLNIFLDSSHSKMPTLLDLCITRKLELIGSLLAFLGLLQIH